MYEVLCEQCWHTEGLKEEITPDHDCPTCGAQGSWLGPFAAPSADRFSRRDSWPLLTSPLYLSAGQTDRRARPR